MYRSFASIGHADIMWSIVSSNCWHSLHLLSVSVFNFLSHNILFVAPGLVLPLLHFQSRFIIIIIIIIIIIVYNIKSTVSYGSEYEGKEMIKLEKAV